MSRLSIDQQKNLSGFFNSLWKLVKDYGIAENDENTDYWNQAVGAVTELSQQYYKTIPVSDEFIIIKNLLSGFLHGLEEQQIRRRET